MEAGINLGKDKYHLISASGKALVSPVGKGGAALL